ncbi:MAG: HutD family protein [Selenomonas sp.]|uniref:HutD/Ves family protein n=1 Tax=Selenomonas sp. TaxID=2053611 RepID=UPI0025DBE23D|nr:HutD family protein [Selenomonas sp.]MCR5757462.1 HutD family protein [Selenomonas sp.]
MNYHIIVPAEQHTTAWSGGLTRELYLQEPTSSYKQRNFTLRISTATVEAETSIFTNLPEYQRCLMVLSGQVSLRHGPGEFQRLQPFQPHYFDGGVTTISQGICQDFNVMWHKEAPFQITIQCITRENWQHSTVGTDFFYAYDGDFLLYADTEEILLKKGELLHIQGSMAYKLKQINQQSTHLIHIALNQK